MKRIWRYWFLHMFHDHGYAADPDGTVCILCGRHVPGAKGGKTG